MQDEFFEHSSVQSWNVAVWLLPVMYWQSVPHTVLSSLSAAEGGKNSHLRPRHCDLFQRSIGNKNETGFKQVKELIVNPSFGLEDCNGKSPLVLAWVADVPGWRKKSTMFKFCLSDSFTSLVFYFELMFFVSICLQNKIKKKLHKAHRFVLPIEHPLILL